MRVLKFIFAAYFFFSVFGAESGVQLLDTLALLNIVKSDKIEFIRLATLE